MQKILLRRLLRQSQRNQYLPEYRTFRPLIVVDPDSDYYREKGPLPAVVTESYAEQPLPSLEASYLERSDPQRLGLMLTALRLPNAGSRDTLVVYHRQLQPQPSAFRRGTRPTLRKLRLLKTPLRTERLNTMPERALRRRGGQRLFRQRSSFRRLKRYQSRRGQQRDFSRSTQELREWLARRLPTELRVGLQRSRRPRRPKRPRRYWKRTGRGLQRHRSLWHWNHRKLWIYGGGLPQTVPELASSLKLWRHRRYQRQSFEGKFLGRLSRVHRGLLHRERWLQLRLQRYNMPLLQWRMSLDYGVVAAMVARPRDQDGLLPRWGNPLRGSSLHPLGAQWRRRMLLHLRFSQRTYSGPQRLKRRSQTLWLQLALEMQLRTKEQQTYHQRLRVLSGGAAHWYLGLHLRSQPWSHRPQTKISKTGGHTNGKNSYAYQVRRSLRHRPLGRLQLGWLLERLRPLSHLHGRSHPPAAPLVGRSEGVMLPRRWRRRLWRGAADIYRNRLAVATGLPLPRPLERRYRRRSSGMEGYLQEALKVHFSRKHRRWLEEASLPETPLFEKNHREGRVQGLNSTPALEKTLPLPDLKNFTLFATEEKAQKMEEPVTAPMGPQRDRWVAALERQQPLPQQPEPRGGYGRRYQLLPGSAALRLRRERLRERLLASYLHSETDGLPRLGGWPLLQHKRFCYWSWWLVPAEKPPGKPRRRRRTPPVATVMDNPLLGAYDKAPPAPELTAPPGATGAPLRPAQLLNRGLQWTYALPLPRYLDRTLALTGRPRRRKTSGFNRGSRAYARLYRRHFLQQLIGFLEERKGRLWRQLVPYGFNHPHSHRWRRLDRRRPHFDRHRRRLLRWGPAFGRRVLGRIRRGVAVPAKVLPRLYRTRPGRTKGGNHLCRPVALGAAEWRLRLRQLGRLRRRHRRRARALVWLNRQVLSVRLDPVVNWTTGSLRHRTITRKRVLLRRRVRSYRRKRKLGRRLERRLRRWGAVCTLRNQCDRVL